MRRIYRDIRNYFLYFRNVDIILGNNVATNGTVFEGKNRIGTNSVVNKSNIGTGTYIGKEGHLSRAVIGRYCSIGNRVNIVTSIHPVTTFVSTHPAFFSLSKQAGFTYVNKQLFSEHAYIDPNNKVSVIIGNDVWIGDEVMILGGIKIGDGAIIGSKSLITKDVNPYTIMGGVPAKEIKKRFSDNQIESLLKIRWWDKDESWISINASQFAQIEEFIDFNEKLSSHK